MRRAPQRRTQVHAALSRRPRTHCRVGHRRRQRRPVHAALPFARMSPGTAPDLPARSRTRPLARILTTSLRDRPTQARMVDSDRPGIWRGWRELHILTRKSLDRLFPYIIRTNLIPFILRAHFRNR